MSTAQAAISGIDADRRTAPARIESVDIFRGLTILTMVFVNDLAGVRGLPWWTYHMPNGVDGMTYVDAVFPAFLFIVGISIPLALDRRIAKDGRGWALWQHVLTRTAGLALLGIVLANAGKVDPELTGMSRAAWSLTAFAGALLVWAVYPRGAGRGANVLRAAGVLLLVTALALFRRRTGSGSAAWLDFSYWEILGLIGWAYLSACVLYIVLKGRLWPLGVAFVALTGMNAAAKLGALPWLRSLPPYVWPWGNGALASIVLAGVLTSLLLLRDADGRSWSRRAFAVLAFSAALLVAGAALSPLGITKNQATPAWCLLCAGGGAVAFLLLYWLCDRMGVKAWAAFVRPAGSNALLTYLLPWIWYSIPGLALLLGPWREGAAGVLRTVAFTALILGIAALLTRWRVRLQL